MAAQKDPSTTGSGELSSGGIARAAGLVMIGFLLSRVLGLVRETVIAGAFGAGSSFEAYVVAARPPDTLFYVIAGGALASAFIPTFTGYLARGQREEAWKLANSVLNLIALVVAGLAIVAAIFALPIVQLLTPCPADALPEACFDPATQLLAANLMRIMLISTVIFAVSGLQMGILNAHQRFLLPALAPSLYNAGIIFGALALRPLIGIYGLAWGVVIGAALHLLVQLPGMIQIKAPFSLHIDLKHPGVREVARLMGPRLLGLAVVQINFWVNIILASGMVTGSVAALQRAWFVLLLPQGLIAQSVATAVFPTFAAQAAREDQAGLARTLSEVLRAVLLLALPATLGLILLRLPVVQVIYQYGVFTLQDSQATAWALLFFSIGLLAHALVEIVTRAFYAMSDTVTPVAIGGGAMALNVLLSLLLIRLIGKPASLVMGPFAGLALANALATSLEGLALLALIGRRVPGFEWRGLILPAWKPLLASLLMGLALWGLLQVAGGVHPLAQLSLAIPLGGGLFWGLALLLGSEEARRLTGLALRRLQRP